MSRRGRLCRVDLPPASARFGPLLIALRIVPAAPRRSATPTDYGRAEDLAGLFVVAMITCPPGLAADQAVRRLLHPQQVTHLWAVAADHPDSEQSG